MLKILKIICISLIICNCTNIRDDKNMLKGEQSIDKVPLQICVNDTQTTSLNSKDIPKYKKRCISQKDKNLVEEKERKKNDEQFDLFKSILFKKYEENETNEGYKKTKIIIKDIKEEKNDQKESIIISEIMKVSPENFEKILKLQTTNIELFKKIIKEFKYKYFARKTKAIYIEYWRTLLEKELNEKKLCCNLNYYDSAKLISSIIHFPWLGIICYLAYMESQFPKIWIENNCLNDCIYYSTRESCRQETGTSCHFIKEDDAIGFALAINSNFFILSSFLIPFYTIPMSKNINCLKKLACYEKWNKKSPLEEQYKKQHLQCKTLCCKKPDPQYYNYGIGECCGCLEYPPILNFYKLCSFDWIKNLLCVICCRKEKIKIEDESEEEVLEIEL